MNYDNYGPLIQDCADRLESFEEMARQAENAYGDANRESAFLDTASTHLSDLKEAIRKLDEAFHGDYFGK